MKKCYLLYMLKLNKNQAKTKSNAVQHYAILNTSHATICRTFNTHLHKKNQTVHRTGVIDKSDKQTNILKIQQTDRKIISLYFDTKIYFLNLQKRHLTQKIRF